MKAVGVTKFGGPEALEVLELPEPQAGPGQVRIRVHAAAVNPTDTLVRSGRVRGDGPWVPGMDAAGVIDRLGPDADDRLSVGQRVVTLVVPQASQGAYAQQVVVPAASVVPAPENTDFPAASTVLMNAMTARLALDELALSPGDTLAVTGAAGALGGYAIQLAKSGGLHVVADAKKSDVETVRSAGADEIVERGRDVAGRIRAAHPEGVRGAIDAAVLNELVLPAIADGGSLATVRFWNEPVERGIKVHPVYVPSRATDTEGLDRLARLVEKGVLTPRVAAVLPYTEAVEAHRRLEAGGVRGRIVLDFS
ncbi:NADP-dependent oxidoreductase [Streptomyces sp. NRRL S-813]|uniref:NADP-dependent oxidoreductase n=1 Tax=Streptomyces sp. NRRL S-813 TaxID=1463919 RepID=UPI0004BF3A63|nr:NADP-dependent oxidoreductase [Streptomyces sp. NRRL S-813]